MFETEKNGHSYFPLFEFRLFSEWNVRLPNCFCYPAFLFQFFFLIWKLKRKWLYFVKIFLEFSIKLIKVSEPLELLQNRRACGKVNLYEQYKHKLEHFCGINVVSNAEMRVNVKQKIRIPVCEKRLSLQLQKPSIPNLF